MGTKWAILSRQYHSILPVRVANHSAEFGSYFPLTELLEGCPILTNRHEIRLDKSYPFVYIGHDWSHIIILLLIAYHKRGALKFLASKSFLTNTCNHLDLKKQEHSFTGTPANHKAYSEQQTFLSDSNVPIVRLSSSSSSLIFFFLCIIVSHCTSSSDKALCSHSSLS